MAHETDEEFLDGISPCTRIVDYGGPIEAVCAQVRRHVHARRAGPAGILRATSQLRRALYHAGVGTRGKPRT